MENSAEKIKKTDFIWQSVQGSTLFFSHRFYIFSQLTQQVYPPSLPFSQSFFVLSGRHNRDIGGRAPYDSSKKSYTFSKTVNPERCWDLPYPVVLKRCVEDISPFFQKQTLGNASVPKNGFLSLTFRRQHASNRKSPEYVYMNLSLTAHYISNRQLYECVVQLHVCSVFKQHILYSMYLKKIPMATHL